MAEDTDEQDASKIKKLASWSSRYRAGVKEMIEGGWDPDELDEAVETAETGLIDEAKEKQKAARRRRSARSF